MSTDGSRLFVSDQPNNALLVADLARREVIATVDLGESPEGVSLSPDGRWVVVAVEVSNSVAFVDTAFARQAVQRESQRQEPGARRLQPRRPLALCERRGGGPAFDIVDVDKRAQVAAVKVGERPRGIAFTPDGRTVYVAREHADKVYAIDVEKQSVAAVIAAGKKANGVAMRPDGKRKPVSNGGDANVLAIDTARATRSWPP
ncbi:MAG: hypothetical protein MZV70_62570 [Desulfobacterales bacterium]|nr:hypothetical protein [Desulfobacterales bacterium]